MKNTLLLRSGILAGLSGLTMLLCAMGPRTVIGESAGVVMELPDEILGMPGTEGEVSEAELKALPSDTEFEKATYYSDDGDVVMSYSIVLSGESRNSIHRPEICLPGQGWSIKESVVRTVTLPDGEELDMKHLFLDRDHEGEDGKVTKLQAHYYYWFVGKDVTTPHHLSRILLTSYDNVFRNVNHRWAYVSLISYVGDTIRPDALNSAETLEVMDEFVTASVQEFQHAF